MILLPTVMSRQVDEPLYFVDFLREPVCDDETGEVLNAHPSNYEAVPGGLAEIKTRVEALQRRFNEESKVRLRARIEARQCHVAPRRGALRLVVAACAGCPARCGC